MSQIKVRKTCRCLATVSGSLTYAMASFVYARGDDGQWWLKVTRHTRKGDEPTRWSASGSPLEVLGVDHASLAGDVTWEHGHVVSLDALPGLNAFGEADQIFITGDIGHRYHLPRATRLTN